MPSPERSHAVAKDVGGTRRHPPKRRQLAGGWLEPVDDRHAPEPVPPWLEVDGRTDARVSSEAPELEIWHEGGLKRVTHSTSVLGVAPPAAYALGDERVPRSVVVRLRLRRLVVLLAILVAVVAATALTVDRLASEAPLPAVALPEPTEHLLPGTAPEPQILALFENLRLFLPVAPDRVTAIGYRGSGADALPLDPFGTLANPGVLVQLKNKLFGGGQDQPVRYYLIEGGAGPQTGGVDIGAPVGTNTYAPVDGTILAINPVVISGELVGHRVDIQPTSSPGLVVTVTNIRVAPGLEAGHTVTASETRLGRLIDVSRVETAALAEFTQDSGHHVHIEIVQAANVALP